MFHQVYENQHPSKDEIVIGMVTGVCDYVVTMRLLEYNGKEATLHQSEIRRTKKSLGTLFKKGDRVLARVVSNDGAINLSKKYMSDGEVANFKEKHHKNNAVLSLVRGLCIRYPNHSSDEIFRSLVWPLQNKNGAHLFDMLKKGTSAGVVTDEYGSFWESLKKEFSKKHQPEAIRIKANLEMTCLNFRGVEGLKDIVGRVLKEDRERYGDGQITVKTNPTSPSYAVLCETFHRERDMARIRETVDRLIQLGLEEGIPVTLLGIEAEEEKEEHHDDPTVKGQNVEGDDESDDEGEGEGESDETGSEGLLAVSHEAEGGEVMTETDIARLQ